MTLPSFPDFSPVVSALRNGQNTDRMKSFRVSTQRHDQLLVLESFAKKWTSNESTAERANAIINEHNKEFNNSEEFWANDLERPQPVVKRLHQHSDLDSFNTS